MVAVSASYNLVTVRWTGTSDQIKLSYLKQCWQFPPCRNSTLSTSVSSWFKFFPVPHKFFWIHPSTIHVPLLCKSFSKSLSKFSGCGQGLRRSLTLSHGWSMREKTLFTHYNTQVSFFPLLLGVYSSSIQKLTCDVTTD